MPVFDLCQFLTLNTSQCCLPYPLPSLPSRASLLAVCCRRRPLVHHQATGEKGSCSKALGLMITPSRTNAMRGLVFATILLQATNAAANPRETCSAEFPGSCDGDPADDCNDYHDSCRSWADEGGCEQSYGYMKYHCPLSCGTCGEIERDDGTPCRDDEYRCVEWAGMGECNENPA